MGLHIGFSRSSYDSPTRVIYVDSSSPVTVKVKSPLPNPNPKNFRIKSEHVYGRYLILEVEYPDCTNYEGNKILMYRDVSVEELEKQGSLDPHFSENKMFHSPIARFEPTAEGLRLATVLACLEDRFKKEK